MSVPIFMLLPNFAHFIWKFTTGSPTRRWGEMGKGSFERTRELEMVRVEVIRIKVKGGLGS